MTQAKYKLENKAVLDSLLLELPNVTTGMVFGLPCYRVNVNVFVAVTEGVRSDGLGARAMAIQPMQ